MQKHFTREGWKRNRLHADWICADSKYTPLIQLWNVKNLSGVRQWKSLKINILYRQSSFQGSFTIATQTVNSFYFHIVVVPTEKNYSHIFFCTIKFRFICCKRIQRRLRTETIYLLARGNKKKKKIVKKEQTHSKQSSEGLIMFHFFWNSNRLVNFPAFFCVSDFHLAIERWTERK